LERETRIELATLCLGSKCSTTELLPLVVLRICRGAAGVNVVVGAVLLLDRKLKVDDPVGAIAAHGFAGAWVTIAVGLFASASYGGVDGFFFGGGTSQFMVQLIGVSVAFLFVFPTSFIVFKVIAMTAGMRASAEYKIRGLDISEHEAAGYPDFAPAITPTVASAAPAVSPPVPVPSGAAVDDAPEESTE
jgi:Amt family ammonium transporter